MNNRIKILHTVRQGQISGGEAHVYDLVTNSDTREFHPVVLSFSNGPMIDMLKEKKIAVYVVDTLRPFNFSTFNNVQAILRAEQIDILHAHGTRALSNSLLPAKAYGIPVIYTVHGWAFHHDQHLPVKKARQLSEKLLINNVDLVTTISNSQERDGIHAINMKKGTVINYGIDLARFNPDANLKDVRSELGINSHKTAVGYITRFNKGKDPFNFINAIAYIKKRNCHDMQFIMVGDGDMKEAAMQHADELNVRDCISFFPYRSDIPEVLKTIDIYCLPSQWERFPIGVLEAMAMRKAIVATAVNGIREAVKHDYNGLIVPPGDEEQLALALMRLHFNPTVRQELAERAYASSRKQFDLKNAVKQYEHLYKGFMKSRMTA